MTTTTLNLPRLLMNRLSWAIADAWTVALRDLIHWLREPILILYNLLYPIISVVMFGYVFGSAMSVAGGGDYREFLMPGMFGQTVMFGIATTMTAVANDTARGVTDRFRSMPMAQSAVVAGRSIADMLNSCIELIVLVACGLVIGWRWRGGLGEALLAVGLLLLLRFALIWVGIYLGLIFKPEAVGAVWGILYPVSIIANTFVSPSMMPEWLGLIAEWNPLSSTVAATRELFGNPGWGGESWIARNALLMAVVWPLALLAIFFPLSVRRFHRLSR